jgi:hypothetical protein
LWKIFMARMAAYLWNTNSKPIKCLIATRQPNQL